MNRFLVPAAILGVVIALALGYWLGTRNSGPTHEQAAAAPAGKSAERKLLYYRHPMGLPDTSPVPKKDSMGMDYIPVYSDEAPTGPGFVIPSDRLQRLGVRTAEAAPRELVRNVRAVGTVQVDERLQAAVAPKFEGYVVRLMVATTGAPVRRGQPLLEVYSPELVSAQEEYLVARRNLDALTNAAPEVRQRLQRLVDASRTRLVNWDIDTRELKSIETGEVQKNLLIRSPVDGVVMEKMARVGQRFMAGETLYQVAGLDTVWLVANVFEQDVSALATGQPARATFDAYPGRVFEGKVAFVYPTLEAETRTLSVRIELPNEDNLLKPGLFGSVTVAGPGVDAAVTVPESAVLDSGTRRLVFAAHDGGRFEAREVDLGARADGYVEVRSGLKAGEAIVIDGNFLIDAESNLRAGAQAFGHDHGGDAQPAPGAEPTEDHSQHATPPPVDHSAHQPAAEDHTGHDMPANDHSAHDH